MERNKNETKHSEAGKGDKSRITDKKAFDSNWEKIFRKKKKMDRRRVNGNGA